MLALYLGSEGNMKAIVHCRSGIGRTGTFLLIFARMLQQMHGTANSITITDTLTALRTYRKYLVENSQQFEFAYEQCNSNMARRTIQSIPIKV